MYGTTHTDQLSTTISSTDMSFSSNYLALKAATSGKKQPASSSASSLTSSTSKQSSKYGETFLATIGTDVVPVPIQSIASINDAAYLKNASFHSISQAAYGLLDTYGINNVMMFVGQHLPINHSMALTEAANVRATIRARMLMTPNLVATAFVNKNWKKIQTAASDKLEDRVEGLYGVRFVCELNGSDIDPRVQHDRSFSTEFVLKLPQQVYDKNSGDVTEVSSPGKKKNVYSTPAKLHPISLFHDSEDDDDDNFEEKKTEDEQSLAAQMLEANEKFSKGDISALAFSQITRDLCAQMVKERESALLGQSSQTSASTILSPGLDASMFLSGSAGTKEGYFGKFNFLDSQDLFHDCFGPSPKLYHSTEKEAIWPEKEEMGSFSDLCQFDVFMNLCQTYYVGDSNVNKESFVREVCANIAKLKQQWKEGNSLFVLTPEELFQQFLRESTNLPDDTSTWTIQLPSQYLVSLNDDITSEITQSRTFSIPSQANLATKMDHINGMRLIKNEASKIFSDQLKAKEVLRAEISRLTNKKLPALYGTSQAEQTITKYKGTEHPDIEVRTVKGTAFPFHKPSNTLSKFPCGFRGCYNCGAQDHYTTKDCPKPLDRQNFFKGQYFIFEPITNEPKTQ